MASASPPSELVPSITFDQAALARRAPLSDDVVLALLTDQAEVAPGVSAIGAKHYLDHVAPDASDRAMASSPTAMARHRSQLERFIKDHLVIQMVGLTQGQRNYLAQQKAAFIASLAEGTERVNKFYGEWARAIDSGSLRLPKIPTADVELRGFTIRDRNGEERDLFSLASREIRANLFVHRQPLSTFLQWSSEAYGRAYFEQGSPSLQRRIYLNPQPEQTMMIFEEVVQEAQRHGLVAKGKVVDVATHGINRYKDRNGSFAARADPIVLYAGDDADRLLAVVEQVYQRHRDAFHNRKAARVPVTIAPGIAVGEEPGDGSLTSHRSGALAAAIHCVQEHYHPRDLRAADSQLRTQAVAEFRTAYREACEAKGIDPDNWAFSAATVEAARERQRAAVLGPQRSTAVPGPTADGAPMVVVGGTVELGPLAAQAAPEPAPRTGRRRVTVAAEGVGGILSGQHPDPAHAAPVVSAPRASTSPPTFDAVQLQRVVPLSNDEVIGLLSEDLEIGPGLRTADPGTYLAMAPADAADRALAASPEAIGGFRAELTELIVSHLRVRADGLDEKWRPVVAAATQGYKSEIRERASRMHDHYRAVAEGERPPGVYRDASLLGLRIPVEGAPQGLDLLSQRFDVLRSNILIRHNAVHWESEAASRANFDGSPPGYSGRIYLNPKPEAAIRTFREVIARAEQQGLTVAAKLRDRGSEAMTNHRKSAGPFDVHADTIILYVTDGDANQLAAIVDEVCDRNPAAFAGRATPKVPVRVRDGVAFGEERGAAGESLTSRRADLLRDVRNRARHQLSQEWRCRPSEVAPLLRSGDPQRLLRATQVFPAIFTGACLAQGVDPHNWAFGTQVVQRGAEVRARAARAGRPTLTFDR